MGFLPLTRGLTSVSINVIRNLNLGKEALLLCILRKFLEKHYEY
jgi:hypothetical protein